MSDPVANAIPAPLNTEVPVPTAASDLLTKPSDLGSFHPLTLGELQLDVEVLQGQVKSLEASRAVADVSGGSDLAKAVDLLTRQMRYLSNTYIREPHFPSE